MNPESLGNQSAGGDFWWDLKEKTRKSTVKLEKPPVSRSCLFNFVFVCMFLVDHVSMTKVLRGWGCHHCKFHSAPSYLRMSLRYLPIFCPWLM